MPHKDIIENNIVDQVAKTSCLFKTITHIPFEYKNIIKLVNDGLYAARLNYTFIKLFRILINVSEFLRIIN